MASPTVTLFLTLLTLLTTYHYLIHPLLISPLRKIPPAHWTCPISPLWILHTRRSRNNNENTTIHALHQRLGPLVRLGPNEISVNSVDGGVRTIYGGGGGSGFEKGAWYAVFHNYGKPNIFSSLRRADHSARKRVLSNVYARSAIQASAALHGIARDILCGRMLPRLVVGTGSRKAGGVNGEGVVVVVVVEAYAELFSGVAMDLITGYCFGLGQASNFTQDPGRCRAWVQDYKARQAYMFWPQEMPRLTAFLGAVGLKRWLLVPRWVDVANEKIAAWVLGLCDAAEAVYCDREKVVEARDRATVYNQLRGVINKSKGRDPDSSSSSSSYSSSPLGADERLEIASELLDQVLAGFDTTGITMTYLAWQLSKPENRGIQRALREELRANGATYRMATTADDDNEDDDGKDKATAQGSCPDFKTLDGLPLLHAVVMESLRLHAAIPGCQPRITPQGASLGPPGEAWSVQGLPANVRVNSYAYTLHLNADVFPQPERWDPYRWLGGDGEVERGGGGEKARWFWAFGSGGRMCIGSHLAMIDMKSIVAAIWGNFETGIVDDAGMIPKGGYTCEPLGSPEGNYLLLSFEPVEEEEGVAS
ncbi:cytochrome P450 3A12 [Diaporthe helianthi]|uniref:Cytochrome P450 3A12 n=1 Tax=Diaporthe helianthi TaxID=158607 RepID=A0A2P5HS18_DIAHE|nr:cytochrome P450 3A12 [Diaporthe helianthi]